MATASRIVLYTNKPGDQSSAGRLGRRSTMRDLIVKISSTLDQSTLDADDQFTERSSFRETEPDDDDVDIDQLRAPTSSSIHGYDGDDGSDSGTAGSLSGPSFQWPDLEVLDPDHPILERFQANLTRLLLDEDEQLNLRIIEMEERRKAAVRDRKRLSVGLDDAKRTSDKVRASLRKEKEALEAERARRADVERKLLPDKRHQLEAARREVDEARDAEARLEQEVADGRNKLADIRQRLDDQQWQLAQARGRLDQGGRHRENTQMQKMLQDMMVAQLMSDLDSAEWKRGQIESQMLEEEQMAAGMREAIRSAHAEIDALNAEKIRLNQHWQSNVLALQRAHEALASTHQAIREEEARREEIIRCFLIGERETAELAAKRTSVQLELGRLERKITNLETQRQDRETAKRAGDERRRLVQSTIASREQELGALIKERDQLIKSEEDALERLHSQRSKCKALEAALLDQVYRSVACDQQGQAIYRDIRRAEEASSQLDLKMAEAESRAARLLIERDDLDKELEAGAKKLDDKTAKCSRAETALKAHRQRLIELHKVVERKDAHLVRIRARLVELGLLRAQSDGTRNEEERAIRVLNGQLDKLRSDCDEMQRQWSRAEQHLLSVAMARDNQTIDEDKLREETQVWQEKKRRLLAELDGLRLSRAQCQRSVHSWREYLQQLDSRLAEQTTNKENLERCNQLFQRQWTMHLEEPERKVERLRLEIESQREQKCNLEISLCNLSKLAMLWTAKLNDIREAQNYIQAERSDLGELALLQAEKHRLEVQETQLKKDQEMLNHQLQKALFGRPLLNAKADIRAGVDHKTRIIRQPVDSSSWHKILSKEITQRRKDLNKLTKLLEQKKATLDDLNAEREELQSSVDEYRQRREHIEADIAQAALSKKKAIGDLTVQQQWWRFYEQLKRGTYRRRGGSESLAESEARARRNLVNLAAVADRLAREHPHLAAQLGEIRESLLQSTNQ